MNRRHAFLEVELCCATAPLWIYQTHSTSRALTLQLCSKDFGSNMQYHDDTDFILFIFFCILNHGCFLLWQSVAQFMSFSFYYNQCTNFNLLSAKSHIVWLHHLNISHFIRLEQDKQVCFILVMNTNFFFSFLNVSFSQFGNHCTFSFFICVFSEASVPLLVDIFCHLSDKV